MGFDCVLGAWRAHEAELRGFLARRLDDASAVDDMLQEVFLKAMRQGQGFCQIREPRAWLFQVARNALVDDQRLSKPFVAFPEDLAQPLVEGGLAVDELGACLARNLRELSEDDARIVRQCDLEGQTVRQFAQESGLGLAAAKSRLLRARQRLRDALVRNCQVRFDEAGKVCCHKPRQGG